MNLISEKTKTQGAVQCTDVLCLSISLTLCLSFSLCDCRKMAGASTLLSHDLYNCPLCQKLLKDPVTIPCGRSFCMECIVRFWNDDDQRCVYICPQCEEPFTPKPSLNRNNNLNKKVEELKKSKHPAASSAHCYAGPGDVECDSCTGRKCKAVISCLDCQASYCKYHLNPHFQSPDYKKHKIVEACAKLQEKIDSEHGKVMEIYCRTDQSMMDKHKGHNTVATKAERTEKQNELKEEQMKSQQRIQEKQKAAQDLKKTVDKSFPSLCVSPGCEDSPSFTVNQHVSFDGVRKSLSDLKERVCEKEFNKIQPDVLDQHHSKEKHTIHRTEMKTAADQMISSSEAENRREFFLQCFCYLTLDPNTVHRRLILSEKNRVVTRSKTEQPYSYHLERFDSHTQVLCKESVCGSCYWEVEWSGSVSISVSYKGIIRKGNANECLFGYNSQSWNLGCSTSSLSFWHNNIETKLRGPASSRIGVYVDHSAGTLSFYSVSDTMRLLHRVHTTFTRPLYAGFRLWYNSTVRLCDST
ncbi:tripartite motif-containing protein 16-like isoform X2 [Hemibagrus wyckioides]|uniref:tripartite motif-containing protein 16-like isoform X2 n=1 Tax=Hemibagrus wyckioides TaxID=337641 RepID=UPI00266DD4BC|nr:tripartite motif-containing protein 16-like isoform X2 [Hemibagrus wyckioides]